MQKYLLLVSYKLNAKYKNIFKSVNEKKYLYKCKHFDVTSLHQANLNFKPNEDI